MKEALVGQICSKKEIMNGLGTLFFPFVVTQNVNPTNNTLFNTTPETPNHILSVLTLIFVPESEKNYILIAITPNTYKI